jgi:hypothetical protein
MLNHPALEKLSALQLRGMAQAFAEQLHRLLSPRRPSPITADPSGSARR